MKIVFLFYNGMTALDAIGPHEILSRLPNAQVYRTAKNPGLISTDSGLMLNAEYSFLDIQSADILLLSGAGSATTLSEHPEIHAWIRKIHLTTQWTTSVCTGSLIWGAAALLPGLKATTHWAALDRLEKWVAIPTHFGCISLSMPGNVFTPKKVSKTVFRVGRNNRLFISR